MKKGGIALFIISLLILHSIAYSSLISASTSVTIYGNNSEIGYIKNNSGIYTISNNSDILIGCVQDCNSYTSRGFSFFDLSSLPDNINIESVYLSFNVNFSNATTLNQTIYDVNYSNWTTSDNSSKFYDTGTGNNYSINITWGQNSGIKEILLNNQSINDINYSINQGLRFGIGFKNNIETNNYNFINITKNSLILNISYSYLPNTNVSAIYSNNGEKYRLGSIGNHGVNITLVCSDCQSTSYCIDSIDSCNPNITYSDSFNFSTYGRYFLRFKSNNSQGFTEQIDSEIIYLDPNAPETSPIVWPKCNPADSCCDQNGYLRPSGFVCKSAYNAVCDSSNSCAGHAYEDRCSGISSNCPVTNDLINYSQACDDLICINQSCSGSTLQPERTCSAGVCQVNNQYECPNNLKCHDSIYCKKQANSSIDCKTGYLFDNIQKVCYLSNNYTYDLRYDSNGNLISIFANEFGLGWQYIYNSFNQLASVKDEGVVTLANYTYDSSGQRIKKTEYNSCFSTNTYYLDNFIQKINSTGTFNETYYFFNGLLVGKKDNSGKINFYHPNQIGSTILITNSTGQVVRDLLYEPFGYQNDSSERYTYTGHEQDNEAGGIVYAGARYYNPETGQFLQADPVIGNIYNPQDLNKYAYARNNPYKYTDPNGELIHIAAGAGIGALIGGVVDIYNQLSNNGGDLVRYNSETNTFGVKTKENIIRTYFRPEKGNDYFISDMAKYFGR